MKLCRARPPSSSRLNAAAPLIALAGILAAFGVQSSRAQTPAKAAPTLPVPSPQSATAPSPQMSSLAVSAQFSGDQGLIRSGLEWRIFKITRDGTTSIVQRSKADAPMFTLGQGDYFVHVSYGFASASKRVTLAEAPVAEKFTLAAGALRLGATLGDQPVPRSKVSYTIYLPAPGDPEGHQLASGIRSGEAVRLAEGVYHVVSTYGDTNATVRTDIKVESGRLTDATLRHRAATMTLKLVETPGGEALADTNWSVFSPGGDIVQESVGAFATMTLAEGLYSVVARHSGKTYARDFKVDTGRDGDVEVLATGAQ
ncbi:MAG: hypothetical protein JO172_04010 [Hyphomicrobiales bacterium]|nr:hypothetical protein [Hyphomicrobiales bacterium]